jgi:Leucine-rich repeat (LRR) protein
MSYTDVVSRVSQIQAQISSLQTAFDPSVAGTSATPSTTGTAATGSTSFAAALAQAQGTGAAANVSSTGGAALPAGAQTQLTSNQQQFASELASKTGLDPSVVSAWLLAEESGGAAQSRQAQSNNDWLNIGYTDSGTYGSSDSVWSNPVTAADATAGWLKGQNTIPGYGTASSGIQNILTTAGQPAAAQISALQNSGWASSGYPSLPSLYQQVAG